MNSYEAARRQSGTFTRMAFSIYGNSVGSGPGPLMGGSRGSNTTPVSSVGDRFPSGPFLSTTPSQRSIYDTGRGSVRFQSSSEVLAIAKSNVAPNLFIIAGPKTLQLTRISDSDITLEKDLVTQIGHGRNAKFGLVSDIKFGYQTYGRNIAASTLSGSIHLYNLDRSNRVRTTYSDHQRAVNSIDFSATSPYRIVSGSQDGKMKIWDLRSKGTRASITMACNADAVRCVQFSPHVDNVLCGIFDSGVIQKWDIRKTNAPQRRINAHSGPGLALDWHPELEYIVTGGRDKQMQVWDMGPESDHNRDPDHVIYTSGPISNVSWCRGRGNGSIMNTDIAACFLNDDHCVQLWNLSRRYIPKTIIESHIGQITGLVWNTPRRLVSCSKDKSVVQTDVTRQPKVVDNLPSVAAAFNPKSQGEIMFIKQNRDDYELADEPVKVSSLFNAATPDSFQGSGATSGTNSVPSELHGPIQSAVSLASSYMTNDKAKKGISSIASHKSTTRTMPKTCPFAVPAELRFSENDPEVFKFLSSNYLIEVPQGLDIIQVCEYNAALAAEAGRYRDCQTWRTISFGIVWQQSEGIQESPIKGNHLAVSSNVFAHSHSTLATSHSDKYGGSPGSKYGSPYGSVGVYNSNYGSLSRHSRADTAATDSSQQSIIVSDANDSSMANESAIADEDEEPSVYNGQGAVPLDIRRNSHSFTKNRFSFTGLSVDFDNERPTLSGHSSMSISRSPVFSRMAQLREERNSVGTDESQKLSASQVESSILDPPENKSKLTAILNESPNPELKVPWNPQDLLREAANWSSSQGDILMCATFALLFKELFPMSITDVQAQEWILAYHETLQQRCYFGAASNVLRRAADMYDVFKEMAQTRTSVRTFCNSCHSLILNESTKAELSKDPGIDFGYWFCEKCGARQGNCVYCNEPLKGICVALLECGHKGHFGCFKLWFVEEGQDCCPACGVTTRSKLM